MRGCAGAHDRRAGDAATAPRPRAAVAAHPRGRAHRAELRARRRSRWWRCGHDDLLNTDDYVEHRGAARRNEEIIKARSRCVCTNTSVRKRRRRGARPSEDLPSRSPSSPARSSRRAARIHRRRDPALPRVRTFQTIWDEANRRAHEQVEQGAHRRRERHQHRGRQGRARPRRRIVARVRIELAERGIGIFDNLPIGTWRCGSSSSTPRGSSRRRTGVRLLDRLRIVLPILVARVRRSRRLARGGPSAHGLMRWGFGVVIATLVLGFGMAFGRDLYLDALPGTAPRPADGAAFDIVVRFLRNSNRSLFARRLDRGVGAYLAGSSRVATFGAGRTTGALGGVGDRAAGTRRRLRRRRDASSRAYVNVLRVVGVVVAFVVLIAMDHPDGSRCCGCCSRCLVYLARHRRSSRPYRAATSTPRSGSDRSGDV